MCDQNIYAPLIHIHLEILPYEEFKRQFLAVFTKFGASEKKNVSIFYGKHISCTVHNDIAFRQLTRQKIYYNPKAVMLIPQPLLRLRSGSLRLLSFHMKAQKEANFYGILKPWFYLFSFHVKVNNNWRIFYGHSKSFFHSHNIYIFYGPKASSLASSCIITKK